MSSPDSSFRRNELLDPMLRSIVSLAVILHLLCVGFVYSANVQSSRLQQRLAGIFGPYTKLLHLDPGGVRLQFTDGSQESDDHVVIVAPKLSDGSLDEAAAVQIPDADARVFTGERRRLLALSNDVAAYGRQRDDLAALLAKSLGESVMREKGFDHVVVRVLHNGAQSLYDDLSPEEISTDYTVYEAEVWKDEDGIVQTQKRATGLGAAPTTRGEGS